MEYRNINLLVCDRCQKAQLEVKDEAGCYKKPNDWGIFEYKDLCPECYKESVKISESFMNNIKKVGINKGVISYESKDAINR